LTQLHIVLPLVYRPAMIGCSKSAQKIKSTFQVCQTATVVMETTQLVLSQFKNFLSQSVEN